MTSVAIIQFWAPFRGRMNVEWAARYVVKQAIDQFNHKWPFPDYDQKEMVCVGARDGYRTVLMKDVPA